MTGAHRLPDSRLRNYFKFIVGIGRDPYTYRPRPSFNYPGGSSMRYWKVSVYVESADESAMMKAMKRLRKLTTKPKLQLEEGTVLAENMQVSTEVERLRERLEKEMHSVKHGMGDSDYRDGYLNALGNVLQFTNRSHEGRDDE